eukprot:4550703-Prymnesium_polylepis.1
MVAHRCLRFGATVTNRGGRPDSTGIFIRGQKGRRNPCKMASRETSFERLASACDTARLGDP